MNKMFERFPNGEIPTVRPKDILASLTIRQELGDDPATADSLDAHNDRPHQGRGMNGRTPATAFTESLPRIRSGGLPATPKKDNDEMKKPKTKKAA